MERIIAIFTAERGFGAELLTSPKGQAAAFDSSHVVEIDDGFSLRVHKTPGYWWAVVDPDHASEWPFIDISLKYFTLRAKWPIIDGRVPNQALYITPVCRALARITWKEAQPNSLCVVEVTGETIHDVDELYGQLRSNDRRIQRKQAWIRNFPYAKLFDLED